MQFYLLNTIKMKNDNDSRRILYKVIVKLITYNLVLSFRVKKNFIDKININQGYC